MMKKALLSLLLVAAFAPFAMAQDNGARTMHYTDISACEVFTWPVNNQTYTADTIVTYVNATDDTIFVLNLTINTPHTEYQTIASENCTYTWRNGVTYDASGNYSDTVTAAANSGLCDSIFNLALTVSNIESATEAASACVSYVWHGDTLTATGTYSDTTVLSASCTHVDVLNLSIVSNLTVNEERAHCGDYVWYDSTYTESGTYTHTVSDTIIGCDTIHTLHLTIRMDTARMTIDSACASKTWRGQTYTASGVYHVLDTNPNTHCVTYRPLTLNIKAPRTNTRDTAMTGCDSLFFTVSTMTSTTTTFRESTVWDTLFYDHRWNRCYDSTIHLTVTINKSGHDTTWVNSCDSFYWSMNKRTYHATPERNPRVASGKDSNGCDSIHVLALTISASPVISAIHGEWHLNAGDTAVLYPTCTEGAAYKWTYGGQTSTDDTLRIPNVQGNIDVALEATLDYPANNIQCSDTSWITIVTFVGINGTENTHVSLYPNPTVGQLNIQSAEAVSEVVVFNTLGQQVASKKNLGTQSVLNLSNLSKGSYTMRLTLENGQSINRKFIITK